MNPLGNWKIKMLVIAFLAGVGFGAGWSAQGIFAWDKPTASPVGGNTPPPLTIGSDDQEKKGGLKLGKDLEITGGVKVGGMLNAAGTFSLQSWKWGVVGDCLFLGTAQAWSASGVSIGSSSCGVPSGAVLDVNGSIRIQGGGAGQGKVLTSASDGTASWETPVAPVTTISAGSNMSVSTAPDTGVVTMRAIMPTPPSVPGWVYPGSGNGGRVPVTDQWGNVSWQGLP